MTKYDMDDLAGSLNGIASLVSLCAKPKDDEGELTS
jgi:hypothetical protein